MAALFDPNNPGEDDPYLSNVSEAYNQGYGYNDLVGHHIDTGEDGLPPQPSLDDAMSGRQISPEMFSPVSIVGKEDTKRSDQDAINEGAGPVGEAIIGAAAGGMAGIARGAIESGVFSDIAGAQANPIRSLVQTTNEGSSAIPFSQRQLSGRTVQRIGRGLRYGAAGVAGDLTFEGAFDTLPDLIKGDVRGIGGGNHRDAVGALPPKWVRNWKPGDPVPK